MSGPDPETPTTECSPPQHQQPWLPTPPGLLTPDLRHPVYPMDQNIWMYPDPQIWMVSGPVGQLHCGPSCPCPPTAGTPASPVRVVDVSVRQPARHNLALGPAVSGRPWRQRITDDSPSSTPVPRRTIHVGIRGLHNCTTGGVTACVLACLCCRYRTHLLCLLCTVTLKLRFFFFF